MLRPLDLKLTKAAIDLSELSSQRSQTSAQQSLAVRTLSLRQISKFSEPVNVEVPRQITSQQRTAAMFIRNTIRLKLAKEFRLMLSRTVIKKTAYKLLTSKRKRDVQSGFLAIKSTVVREQHEKLHNFMQKQTEVVLLCSIIKKWQNKNKFFAFGRIKRTEQRNANLQYFCKILFCHVENGMMRIHCSEFLSQLKLIEMKSYQKECQTQNILRIDTIRRRNIEEEAFNHVIDVILFEECSKNIEMKKTKIAELTSNATTRKQTLAQLREQLKNLKVNIQQEKLARNRVFQQRKKYNNTSKITMAESVRKYEKQKKVEDAITSQIEEEFNEQERIFNQRQQLRNKSMDSEDKCNELYSNIYEEEGNVIKYLLKKQSNLQSDVKAYKESASCLADENLRMQKLIQLYEKRESYNYEAAYYELFYENNVIRETIRNFIKDKYEIWLSHQRRCPDSHKSQDSQLETEAHQ